MTPELEDLARRLDELDADQAARLARYLGRGYEEPPAGAPAPPTARGPRAPELSAAAELAR